MVMAGNPLPSTFNTAMSVFGSVPTTLAFNWRLSAERDANVGGAVDHVVVRQNVAVRAHDDARAEAVFALVALPVASDSIGPELPWPELLSEELLEKWRHSIRHVKLLS